jgi:hypothetical protein
LIALPATLRWEPDAVDRLAVRKGAFAGLACVAAHDARRALYDRRPVERDVKCGGAFAPTFPQLNIQ